jgi:hypothetical protein
MVRGPASGFGARLAAILAYRETGDPFPAVAGSHPGLAIGLSSSLSCGFLRELIRRLRADPAAPPLSFVEGPPAELIAATDRGRVDLAFVAGDQHWAGLRHEALWRERLILLAPDGHTAARELEASPKALRGETFLVAGEPEARAFQRRIVSEAIGAAPVMEVDVERETVAELVSLGFGLALTTTSSLGAFHPGVVYRPVAAPPQTVAIHPVWRPSDCDGGLAGVLETARALAEA